ncbi:TetR/AcrR family transcriptional regulator [Actinokineospora soli]|uniref:TetR/AcrR family transcriptional regulator n=1 Tax=Actinokineospora soli TaxID=1048753 RepID=A0ABW2TS85_9PSEU
MQRRGVQRRRDLVDAAIELFGAHGYANTTVAAVAEKAGVTPSALIHHFGSKENLLRAVLDEFDARSAARVAEHAGAARRDWSTPCSPTPRTPWRTRVWRRCTSSCRPSTWPGRPRCASGS